MMRVIILWFVLMVFTVNAQSVPEPMDTWIHDNIISAIAWSPDGQSLAIATGEVRDLINPGQIHIYTLEDQTLTLLTDDVLTATSLAWRASDNAIFSSHTYGLFFQGWDSQTGELIAQAPEGGSGGNLAFNPVDERLAVSYGGVLGIYDADLTTPIEDSFLMHVSDRRWVDSYVMAWTPDGEQIITVGHPDAPEFLSLWIPSGDITTLFEESDRLTPNGFDLHLALSSDGEWLAAATGSNARWAYNLPTQDIFIWSTSDGTLHHHIEVETNGSIGLAWSPDDRFLASGGVNGTLVLWNMETENIHTEWVLTPGELFSIAWSRGNLLAVALYGEVLIFDMNTVEWE
jgi:WD40 repeat protein